MRELDAELPVANVLTMREILSDSVGSRRFQTLLAGVFAAAALLLACLGIYGVISYSVARRTNEIGIRIALGAQASQVSMLVMRQGVRPVCVGLLVGVAAALAAGPKFPLRHRSARPGGNLGGGPVAASGRRTGVLGARAPCVPDRSDDCPAERLTRAAVI
jgi:hypothetical protein